MAGRKTTSSDHQIALRVRSVQEWMMQDQCYADIITQGMNLWNVSRRQVERYMQKAEEGFLEMNKTKLDRKRAYYIQRSKKALRDLDPNYKRTPQGVFAQQSMLAFMAKIDGVTVEQTELNVSGNAVVFIGKKPVNKD